MTKGKSVKTDCDLHAEAGVSIEQTDRIREAARKDKGVQFTQSQTSLSEQATVRQQPKVGAV